MAKCELSITLDDPNRTYLGGQTVTGQVHVDVNEPVQCDGLKATLQWRTHGRGNIARGQPIEVELFTGEWRPGESASYPFEFKLPLAPATYHGNLINLDWYINARADIPWAFDPKAEADLIMLAGESGGEDAMIGAGDLSESTSETTLMGLLFTSLVIGVMIAGFGFGGYKEWGDIAGYVMSTCSGIMVLVLIWVVFHSIFTMMAQRKLGPVEFLIDPPRVAPGQQANISLRFSPRARVHIEHITATFMCEEEAVSGSGTNRSTHQRIILSEEIKLAENTDLKAGERFEEKIALPIPAEGPLSLNVSSNSVSWTVRVAIDIKGAPEISRKREVWVWY